jgi:hypothetical protein
MPNATLTTDAVVGELRRDVKHWSAWAETHRYSQTLHAMALARVAALEAATQDVQRLEWMTDHRAAVVSSEWRADRAVGDEAVTVEWDRCGDARNRVTRRPDARAAIDAAMRGEIDTADDFGSTPADDAAETEPAR